MAIANKFGLLLPPPVTSQKWQWATAPLRRYEWGLAVIADVPKTRVYSLCWLNSKTGATNGKGEILPANILTVAELKPVKLIKTPAALRHSGRHIATLDSQSPICCQLSRSWSTQLL